MRPNKVTSTLGVSNEQLNQSFFEKKAYQHSYLLLPHSSLQGSSL